MVAERLARERISPVIDVGGGRGRLAELLPGTVVVDFSPTQLADAPPPKLRGDALALPFASGAAGAVAMLWMLYHLDDPVVAIAEARRVLRPGGLFAACTASRRNDPELTDGYPPSPFDAEEAPAIVASVFVDVDVDSWDGPYTVLPDRDAVLRYCRSHFLPSEAADGVTPPVTLTKRGCLVWARR
jgi:SAM-dependent methyltransferase